MDLGGCGLRPWPLYSLRSLKFHTLAIRMTSRVSHIHNNRSHLEAADIDTPMTRPATIYLLIFLQTHLVMKKQVAFSKRRPTQEAHIAIQLLRIAQFNFQVCQQEIQFQSRTSLQAALIPHDPFSANVLSETLSNSPPFGTTQSRPKRSQSAHTATIPSSTVLSQDAAFHSARSQAPSTKRYFACSDAHIQNLYTRKATFWP